MAYIGKTPVIGNFQVCDAISVVDAQAAYTMQVGGVNVSPESANHMLVSLNGILQAPTSSFTVSGSTITFASALETGDVIDFIQILGNVLDLGVPSDNTVSLAKLTATGTKDATTFLRGDNTFAVPTDNGKVLQVVTATDSTQRTTTSTSFVTASNTLSVSITPSSASNKIFITVTGNLYIDANGGYGLATIFRGATNLGDATYGMASVYAASSTVIGSMSMSVLDSPSTTSATTYQVYIKRYGGNNVYIQEPVGKSSITAFEIGA